MLHFTQDTVQDRLADLLIAKTAGHRFGSGKSTKLSQLVRGRSAAAQGKVRASPLAGLDALRYFRPHGLEDISLKDIRQAVSSHISQRHRANSTMTEAGKLGRESIDIPAMGNSQNGKGQILVIAQPGLVLNFPHCAKHGAYFA